MGNGLDSPAEMGEPVSKAELDAKLDKEFEEWRKQFSSTMVGVPQVRGDVVRTYEFRCKSAVSQEGSEEKRECGNLIIYLVCGSQLRPYIPPDVGIFGDLGISGLGGRLGAAMSPLLYKRIKPYLYKNGFVFCERCGALYRIAQENREDNDDDLVNDALEQV